jgi:hypothetical protein
MDLDLVKWSLNYNRVSKEAKAYGRERVLKSEGIWEK